MTNEIKEKIEYLKKFAGIYEGAMITEIEDYITDLQKDYYDLKTRIHKAIKYIKWNLDKNEELIEYFNYDANFNELLDILRGDE